MGRVLDPRAASGFTAAEDYVRGRPSYPDAVWEVLGQALSLRDDSVVVDLAAGTGQVAKALRARAGVVVAVEPVAGMRAELAKPRQEVRVLGGVAEALPLAGESVDAVVVGEAFHWFDVALAAREIARVLRPGGGLGLLWNVATWTEQDTPWLGEFRALVAHHKQAAGAYPAGDGQWRAQLERTERFEQLRGDTTEHRQWLQPREFLAQVNSWSWVTNLPSTVRERLLTEVDALVHDEHEITIPYRTDIYWTPRR